MRTSKSISGLLVTVAVVTFALTAETRAEVVIDTVPVGNPGNTGENSGVSEPDGWGPDRICGAVDYTYNIGRYEVTAGQYTEFLNAVAASDPYGLYNASMDSDSEGCQITRNGTDGNYTYDFSGRPSGTEADWANRPVNYVSWGDSARFANWLHNGQPGLDTPVPQDENSTEDGSYFLDGAVSNAELMDVERKEGIATWVIPSEDEWYKAAYHKNNGVTGNYWDYPMETDTMPTSEPPPGTDMTNGSANYYDGGYAIGSPYYRTEVGAYDAKPSDSPYGTFDQGGNVWEFNEAVVGSYRGGLRGGSCAPGAADGLQASRRYDTLPPLERYDWGFRVAEVPDCNMNGIPDPCDLDCGSNGGPCDVPGCGGSSDCNTNGVPDECDLDVPIWTLKTATGPSPRGGHKMAYDSGQSVIVLFGGYNGIDRFGNTWEWDGSEWAVVSTNGPSPRHGHAMAYDSLDDVTVLFGGEDGTFDGETWQWDGNTWTQRFPPVSPSPRRSHAMAYDSARGVVVLFGGYDGVTFGDTWEWDGTAWVLVQPGDPAGVTAPAPNWGHAMAFDTRSATSVLFGGYPPYHSETWTFGPRSHDCNTNGVPDECDITACTGDPACADCNSNGVPDGCELAANDCNSNGVPDECEPNFDGDADIDDCDADIDDDGVPNEADECDYTPLGTAVDSEGRPLGDIDEDCDTDLADYALFQDGFTGPLP